MRNTRIEWCDATWNPITGCFNDCEYCFARNISRRFGGCCSIKDKRPQAINTDSGLIFDLETPMLTKNKQVAAYPFDFTPTMHRYRLDQPKKWKEPQTIFVCSMADLFGDWVPDEWIRAVFEAAEAASQHRYIFLTKNPKRIGEIARAGWLPKHDNWWWGSTVTDMNARRYPGRFTDHTMISIEPLLERLDVGLGSFGNAEWIIIGAESGNRKEKVIPEKEWVDNICRAADLTHAAVFMKDSLISIMGEENMRREYPWKQE